jgi:hypothetical protein
MPDSKALLEQGVDVIEIATVRAEKPRRSRFWL